MNQTPVSDSAVFSAALLWAAEHQPEVTVSHAADGGWVNLRSRFIDLDPENGVLQIAYPLAGTSGPPGEIGVGDELGISFRRGHKKCLFVSAVAMRCKVNDAQGGATDALVLQAPAQVRELQRRVFQRLVISPERFIAVKLWEGGVPVPGAVAWPLCAGRVTNVSVGGVLVDVRADQNPRLRVGDIVGVEITTRPGSDPISVDARYRHCVMSGEDRLGLGFQFVGLEHDRPGQSSIATVADYVRHLRKGN